MMSRNRTNVSDASDLYRAVSRINARSIESLRAARAGPSGSSSVQMVHDADADLALRLAAKEARQLEAFEQDRALAMRLARREDDRRTPPPELYHLPIITPNNLLPPSPRSNSRPLAIGDDREFNEQLPAISFADGDCSPRMPGAFGLPHERHSSPQHLVNEEEGNRRFRSSLTSLTMLFVVLSTILHGVHLVLNYSLVQPIKVVGNWYNGAKLEKPPVASETETARPSTDTEHEQTRATAPPVASVLKGRTQRHDCVSCMECIRGAEVLAPCGHHYDAPCVLELFAAATRDESLFPPRCCRREIPLAMIQPFMAASALKAYREKAAEFGTPKRVYCARQACSRFLGAQFEATSASRAAPLMKCPAVGCSTTTCSGCKNEVKPSILHLCAGSDADTAVLKLAETSGWARCPGCRTLIELNQGCYHMTCRCKAQFCYLCQASWKTCACPQWDEERLFRAAEARAADNDVGLGILGALQQLREHHECTHERWRYRGGGGRCEECDYYLPRYLFRCARCRILVCRRCRWNRL